MSEEDQGASETTEATDAGAETEQATETKDDSTGKTYTESEVDSRVSRGIKSALEKRDADTNKKAEQDRKIALMQDGKYEELYNSQQADIDALRSELGESNFKSEAQAVLVKLGLSHFADALLPNTKTIDELLQRAEAFKAGVKAKAAEDVRQALDTGKPSVPSNTKAPVAMTVEEAAKDPETWKAYKTAHGLA